MVIEFSLIQNFLLALAIVSIAVILIYIAGVFLSRRKHPKTQTPDEDLETGYKSILKTANRHAKSVLAQTTLEAANILQGSKMTNENIEEDLDRVMQSIAQKDIQTLKQTTGEFEKDYQAKIKNIQDQLDQTIHNMIETAQKTYNERLDKFTQDLLRNGISTQDTVDKKTAELLSKVQVELDEYKKSQLAKIETDSKKMIEKIYRDVLKVSIPDNLHKDLILKALEDAKKDGLFKL